MHERENARANDAGTAMKLQTANRPAFYSYYCLILPHQCPDEEEAISDLQPLSFKRPLDDQFWQGRSGLIGGEAFASTPYSREMINAILQSILATAL